MAFCTGVSWQLRNPTLQQTKVHQQFHDPWRVQTQQYRRISRSIYIGLREKTPGNHRFPHEMWAFHGFPVIFFPILLGAVRLYPWFHPARFWTLFHCGTSRARMSGDGLPWSVLKKLGNQRWDLQSLFGTPVNRSV